MANPLVTIKDLQKIDAIASNKFSNVQDFYNSFPLNHSTSESLDYKILDSMEPLLYKGEVCLQWSASPDFCRDNFITPLVKGDVDYANLSSWFTLYRRNCEGVRITFDPQKVDCSLEHFDNLRFYCSGVRGLYEPELHSWLFQMTSENHFLFAEGCMGPQNLQAFTVVAECAM